MFIEQPADAFRIRQILNNLVSNAVKNFKKETNMSVITEDGSFYTFNVKYATSFRAAMRKNSLTRLLI